MQTAGRSPAGTAAAAVAFLLPVAFSPQLYTPFWSPKAAVLLVAGAVGLVLLVAQALARRPAALAGLVFVMVITISAVVSPAPRLAIVGLYNWGTGAVFWIAVIGVWALGASTVPDDRRIIGAGLLAGVGVSGAVAALQTVTGLPLGHLPVPGRANGLAGNPVHLGALAVSCVVYGAWQRPVRWMWPAVAFAGAAIVQLSGTRAALLLLPIAAGAALLRTGKGAGILFAATVAAGTIAGGWLADTGNLASASGRSVDDGHASLAGGGGTRVRVEVWTSSLPAVAERPLLGHGPGRFRAANSPHRTLTVAQLEGGDNLYVDAHNIVVEHLVTTGIVGVAALLTWFVLAARTASGPLLAFAAALAAMALVQPASVGTTPLLALALGASGAAPAAARFAHRKVLIGSAAAVGLLAATVLVTGDHRLEQARLELEIADAEGADHLLGPWPESATMLARAHAFAALDRRSTVDEVLRWRTEALRRDPADPTLALLLAREAHAAGRLDVAADAYERALSWNGYSTSALVGLATLADERGDPSTAAAYLLRAQEVRPSERVERRIERLQNAERPDP